MDRKENFLLKLIRRGINAKYSVPAWLWVILSVTVGVLLSLIAFFDPSSAVTFLAALPFSGKAIGPLLALFSGTAMFGMATSRHAVVRWASFGAFLLWLFVGFAFFIDGGIITFLIMPLEMIVFWAYKYLASWVREIDGI